MSLTNRKIPRYKIENVSNQNLCGIPLGGIGAGSIELRPDGCFHDWQIFNDRPWKGEKILMMDDESRIVGPWESMFAIWVKEENKKPVIRLLQKMQRIEMEMPYLQYDIKHIRKIEYNGEFPFATLQYDDLDKAHFPVEVSMEAFSSFIPLDTKNSSLPGIYITFKVKNPTDKLLSTSILMAVPNPLGYNMLGKKLLNTAVQIEKHKAITFTAEKIPDTHPTVGGSLTVLATNPDNEVSYLANREYLPMRGPYLGIWDELKQNGTLPNIDRAENYEEFVNLGGRIINGILNVGLDVRKFKIMYQHMPQRLRRQGEFFVGSNIAVDLEKLEKNNVRYKYDIGFRWNKYIEFVVERNEVFKLKFDMLAAKYPDIISDPAKKITAYEDSIDMKTFLQIMFPLDAYSKGQQGLLCTKVELKPHEEKQIGYILSWYFPNHVPLGGSTSIGHMYENWFKDSEDVASYLLRNRDDLYSRTLRFKEELYNSTFEYWIADSINAQLSTLVKSTFYDKQGRFAIWEGLGMAGILTTDVNYYASFPVIHLFPELALSMIESTANHQLTPKSRQYIRYAMAIKENALEFDKYLDQDESLRYDEQRQIEVVKKIVKKTGRDPDGRIPHYFPGTFDEVDEYLQLQNSMNYVLEVYRNYLFLGDKDWLDTQWSKTKKAMEQVISMHIIDHELGLPYMYREEETNERISTQTYDGWDFEGYSLYVNTLWIASLMVSIKMGNLYSDKEYSEKMQDILDKAQKSTEKLLWNGEYYNLWCNPHTNDRKQKEDYFIHTDGLNGQWYGHYLSLGDILTKSRIRSMLTAIATYCHIPGEGVLNGFYPDKYLDKTDNVDWNYQSTSPWTGTEYCIASLFLQEGMVKEALQIVKDVYERYLRIGALWKHIECGSHYSRALDIWCVLMDLEGFLYDATQNLLHFHPKLNFENFRSIFATGTSWGILSNASTEGTQDININVYEGNCVLKKLNIGLPEGIQSCLKLSIILNSTQLESSYTIQGSTLKIELSEIIRIVQNEVLKIGIVF